tara:strand:- start:1867 stop:2784 length:918 start_codon:yes stop_codon:yes gene_type:complete
MIELRIKDKLYSGWKSVVIEKDMLSIANTFSISIDNGLQVGIEAGDKIQILKDKALFLTGYIDSLSIAISETKSPLILNGRSLSCDIIDCMIEENKQYIKQTALTIVQDVIKDFSIKVSSKLSLTPLETFDTKVGETFFNSINRICKQTNILPLSDNNGNIVLTRNDKTKYITVLKDSDLKEISYTSNLTSQYSKYSYKKESALSEVTDGSVENSNIKRYRPFVGVNTENKTNLDLANWKKNNSIANGTQLSIKVDNWDLEINKIIAIDSQLIKDSFLIKSISYEKSDLGLISSVTLVDKGLFNV